MYTQHGGSGLGQQYSEVLAMEWVDCLRFFRFLQEEREAESKAIEKASKVKR